MAPWELPGPKWSIRGWRVVDVIRGSSVDGCSISQSKKGSESLRDVDKILGPKVGLAN